jgi:hypothetical protein
VYKLTAQGGTQGGVFATSNTTAMRGFSGGSGVEGVTNSSNTNFAGIVGETISLSAGGLAGRFIGNVTVESTTDQPGDLSVDGMLTKGGGSFKIDHPLDPEHKYLYHSFVESPDMKNIYDGTVITDDNGEAVVQLPDWFEALNRDFRYQLTVIGTFAQAIVAEKIKGHRFKLKTTSGNVEVSWQVTGIRRDAWANKNRIPVEQDKTASERGYYLHATAFDQPEQKSIQYARDPEGTERRKQQRLEAQQIAKPQPDHR